MYTGKTGVVEEVINYIIKMRRWQTISHIAISSFICS
jgi:hypothetical protein